MISLRVPASTANLGPGFDCLGGALRLYLRCRFEPGDVLAIKGCPSEYQNSDNLIYQSYVRAMEALGGDARPLRIAIDSDIPFSRGLGSSAAAILAGVTAAYTLSGKGLPRDEIFALAAEIEGHPDNVAAACYGGLRASLVEDGRHFSRGFAISSDVLWTALVPDFELSTERARAALPRQVSLADAVYNQAHSLMLMKALEQGDFGLLRQALRDRLHQPYRLPLIQDGPEIVSAVQKLGGIPYLSGAGPSLMCLHERASLREELGKMLSASYPHWRLMPLEVDHEGVQIL